MSVTIYKAKHATLLCASTLITLMFISASDAQAQQVEALGDNGTYIDGCGGVTAIPTTCMTQTFLDLPDFSAPTHNFPLDYRNGVLVGTNLTNGNSGPSALGGITVTHGGYVESAFLYMGYESNTRGIVRLEGSGTEWVSTSGGIVGHHGTGEFYIDGGATYKQVNTDYFYMGYGATGNGNMVIRGVDTASGQRSSVEVLNRAYFGENGVAVVNILNGGLFSADYTSVIGEHAGSSGLIMVSGVHQETGLASTFRIVHNQLWVGWMGEGSLYVQNGGQVIVGDGVHTSYGNGYVLVDGIDAGTGTRSTITADNIDAGYIGDGGDVIVRNGGLTVTQDLRAGVDVTGRGVFTVTGRHASGVRSTLEASGNLYAGYNGSGTFNILDGALLHAGNEAFVGQNIGSFGQVYIDGAGSELITDNTAYIGHNGRGILTVSDDGHLKADVIHIADGVGSVGELNIGDGDIAGTIDANYIWGGNGDATLNINHEQDIHFNTRIEGTLNLNHISSGTTTLGAANTYDGTTTVNNGLLRAGLVNGFSANSDFFTLSNGAIDLDGKDQSIRSFVHFGHLSFGGMGGTTLNISGDMEGYDGTIEMHAVLGDDNSLSDKIITQNTSGHNFITVRNHGGMGAPTQEGLRLIEIQNTSDGQFTLQGDYTHEGQDVVVGGAYAYKLYQGSTSDPNDGHWYLRSQMFEVPADQGRSLSNTLYQAGVPSYEVYPQALLQMNELSSLQERVGNRSWAVKDIEGMSGSADGAQPYSVPHIENGGIWTRVVGVHNHNKPKASRPLNDFTQNIVKAQVGVDMVLSDTDNGKLIGGVFGQYAHGKTDVSSRHGDGELKTNGYGGGASVTWYQHNDSYIDFQAQGMWYKSDIHSKMINRRILKDNDGIGYAASGEYGTRIQMDEDWSVTPQAQITYSHVHFDTFIDPYGAQVKTHRGNSLQGRVGLTADHERAYYGSQGKTHSQHVYAMANLYYEFLQGASVDVATTQFSADNDRLWGGVGVGGSQNWNDGQWSLYGEAMTKTSLKHFGDSYSVQGTVGLRMKW